MSSSFPADFVFVFFADGIVEGVGVGCFESEAPLTLERQRQPQDHEKRGAHGVAGKDREKK